MKERDYFSLIALVLVVIGEVFALCGIRNSWCTWGLWTLLTCILLFVLWVIGQKRNHQFNLRSIILTKLLANAIVPRTLGSVYLLLFVIHIGWLTNTAMSLFMPSEKVSDVLIAAGVCLIGMLVLIMFFPNGGQQKDKCPTKVFISGISSINYKNQNLLPIVRMLQLTNDDNDSCELFILHSNYYANPKNDSWINKNFEDYFNDTIEQISDKDVKKDFKNALDLANDITAKLKILIQMVAVVEFPQKKWIPGNMKITFSEQCDYETFDSCFTTLDKIVKEKDNIHNKLFFNITPGTVNVGALMTLMAIDGFRRLYYYIPKNEADKEKPESEEEKRKRLKEVNKKNIPLQSLLSQALESLEESA